MSNIPSDLRYTKEHGWVRVLADAVVELGVTEHGQDALGDIVSVELPVIGRRLAAGEGYVTLESTKTAFEVTSPVAGEVSAVNAELNGAPELVNQDPYGKGWLVRLRADRPPVTSAFLDASAYETLLRSESA
jgi:glycine cleavage system H protein